MARRAGVYVTAESNASSLDEAFGALEGQLAVLDEMAERAPGRAGMKISTTSTSIKKNVTMPIRAAFDKVSKEWAGDVNNALDRRAQAGRGAPWMDWTRHLYKGGNPGNMGDRNAALVTFEPSKKNTVSSFGLDTIVKMDPGTPSWSPVSNDSKSDFGRPYPDWPERAVFMMAPFVKGAFDGKFIEGDRSNQHGPWPSQMTGPNKSDNFEGRKYIIGKDPSTKKKYIFADKFKMDYRAQKAERDMWLERQRSFTSEELLARLDRNMKRAIMSTIADASKAARLKNAEQKQMSKARVNQASPGLMRLRGRTRQNKVDANRYAQILAREFAALIGGSS